MKPLQLLVTTIHGSHLYGTSTPESDRDYKGVHLPSGQGILLQRPENVMDSSQVIKDHRGKNTGDSIDHQSYSVAKFVQMLADGDGVATEILFAPDWAIVEAHEDWETLRNDARKLLNREVKGFVGYCKQQAGKYGIKGSRMAAVEKLVDMLGNAIEKHGEKARLEVIEDELREMADKVEHINFVMVVGGHGKEIGHVECCERKMAVRGQIGETYKVFNKVWKNYGERARAAKTNEGVDWKSISHAVRVASQATELLKTGFITFPRQDAEYLLAIKQGKFEYKDIAPKLEDMIDRLDLIESVLPPETDPVMMDEIILPRYLSQIR